MPIWGRFLLISFRVFVWLGLAQLSFAFCSTGHAATIVAHIYDNSTGLPVVSATVQITSTDGAIHVPPLDFFSDETGKVTLSTAGTTLTRMVQIFE